jgi:hypothetical protein
MAAKDKLPAKIQQAIEQIGVEVEVGGQVTSDQTDALGKLHDIQERGKHNRTIINAWKQQQDQDRKMRKMYATWLMIAMSGQVVAVNVVFVLIGCGLLKFEPWTANTFIMAVFTEISALVLLVVKYLFPTTSDKVLELIDRFRVKDQAK